MQKIYEICNVSAKQLDELTSVSENEIVFCLYVGNAITNTNMPGPGPHFKESEGVWAPNLFPRFHLEQLEEETEGDKLKQVQV